MNSKLIIFFSVFFYVNTYCQNDVVDSTSIIFKAALFTLSEYGVANKEQILKDVENQEIAFLRTKYKHFIFLRIKFLQPYRLGEGLSENTLIRDCYYYVAFNNKDKKFYRIGGFDNLNIDDFIHDLDSVEKDYILDWNNRNEIEGIDIDCLYNYAKLNKKERLKKGFTCFENCTSVTKLFYTEY
ncbi:hypothetical protein D3C87_263840 [compost metagenome]